MLSVEIDEVSGLAILEPDGPLTKGDFELAAKVIDPYIENTDQFSGIRGGVNPKYNFSLLVELP